jgi:hypothetical protein
MRCPHARLIVNVAFVFRQDPMLALLRQAQRAQDGDSDGMSYMTVPF